MIDIIPAIDLIEGQSVRLEQGDYQTKSLMPRTAKEAIKFYNQFEQVKGIHIIDLLAAKGKKAKEMDLISELRALTDLPIQIGGGLRNEETIRFYDSKGIDYFILGTKAITDFAWLEEMTNLFPARIIVGIDARDDYIYINGWTENSGIQIPEYLAKIEKLNLQGIIYTDIAKDGMNNGPNFEKTAALAKNARHKVIASGGVRDYSDLKKLAALEIPAAIVGKAANTDAFWQPIVD